MATHRFSFWLSSKGLAALGFIVAVSYFLFMEHREHLFQFLPFLILLLCLLMHIFMHGGHSGHGDTKQSDKHEGTSEQKNCKDKLENKPMESTSQDHD